MDEERVEGGKKVGEAKLRNVWAVYVVKRFRLGCRRFERVVFYARSWCRASQYFGERQRISGLHRRRMIWMRMGMCRMSRVVENCCDYSRRILNFRDAVGVSYCMDCASLLSNDWRRRWNAGDRFSRGEGELRHSVAWESSRLFNNAIDAR